MAQHRHMERFARTDAAMASCLQLHVKLDYLQDYLQCLFVLQTLQWPSVCRIAACQTMRRKKSSRSTALRKAMQAHIVVADRDIMFTKQHRLVHH